MSCGSRPPAAADGDPVLGKAAAALAGVCSEPTEPGTEPLEGLGAELGRNPGGGDDRERRRTTME